MRRSSIRKDAVDRFEDLFAALDLHGICLGLLHDADGRVERHLRIALVGSAGLAVGYWSSTEDVLQNWSVDREFMPGIPDDERTRRLNGWNKAVRCSYGWAKEE